MANESLCSRDPFDFDCAENTCSFFISQQDCTRDEWPICRFGAQYRFALVWILLYRFPSPFDPAWQFERKKSWHGVGWIFRLCLFPAGTFRRAYWSLGSILQRIFSRTEKYSVRRYMGRNRSNLIWAFPQICSCGRLGENGAFGTKCRAVYLCRVGVGSSFCICLTDLFWLFRLQRNCRRVGNVIRNTSSKEFWSSLSERRFDKILEFLALPLAVLLQVLLD